MILGVGIMMGAYWAYETLNFGGYWNWDPVENAVYIPWLVMIAAIHTMVIYRRSKAALRTTFLLVIASFLLVLYATFLTRSGILGNASVHSFTDLGLSGQLFTYMAAFVVLAIGLLVWRWKKIPATQKELTTYNTEFWVFIGAAVLCLGAFQVLATTSIPVYNSFMGFIGIKTNAGLARRSDCAIIPNSSFGLGVAIAALSGFAQVLWYRKNDKENVSNALAIPLILTFLFSALFLLLGKIGWMPAVDITKEWMYVILLLTSLFAIFSNLSMMFTLLQKKVTLSGGAIAHIGMAMILFGILYSAGYSKVVSENMSGLLYSREFPDEMNRDNVLLWRNQTTEMSGYKVTYKGQFMEVKDVPEYVNKQVLFPLADPYKMLARAEIKQKGKTYFKTGDTVEVSPENTYYQVEYKEKDGKTFMLWPRAQVNEEMGLLASPDIKSFANRDLYTHVSSIPQPDEEKEWSESKEHLIGIKDTIFINDYVAVLYGLEKTNAVQGIDLNLAAGDVAVQADMKVFGEKREYHIHPVFVIKDKLIGRIPDEVEDLGIRITFNNIDPVQNKFSFGVETTQKDYIIMKAMEKPFINIMWIGVFVMTGGFIMAIVRRQKESKDQPESTDRPKVMAKHRKRMIA